MTGFFILIVNRNAGYYSTDEVISIYRSKLEKLRSLYVGQFSVLKNSYIEYRKRFLADTRKGKSRRTSFTSNPTLLNLQSNKVSAAFKGQQVEEKAKSSLLLRYHHQKGRMAVLEALARMEYEVRLCFASFWTNCSCYCLGLYCIAFLHGYS